MAKSTTAVDSILSQSCRNDATDLLSQVKNFSRITPAFGLIILVCISASFAVLFSLSGYIEPDTCWLIKTGQIILKTTSLPQADPFSFTTALVSSQASRQPYVIYQWLSEVAFAAAFRLGALNGPLILCSFVSCVASICILFRVCLSTRASSLWCFLMVSLACGAVAVRLMVRPEIFTLLFIALWLAVMQRWQTTGKVAENEYTTDAYRIDKVAILSFAGLTLLWCNFHSGFIIGILLLVLYNICFLVSDLLQSGNRKVTISARAKTASIALVVCLAASLFNPAGVGLWAYLPRLFFSPMNKYLDELSPVSLNLFLQPIYYPFFLLVCVSSVIAFMSIRHLLQADAAAVVNPVGAKWRAIFAGDTGAALVVLTIAILVAIFCRRLISPLSLLIAVETCALAGNLWQQGDKGSFPGASKRLPLFLELPVIVVSVVGVLFTSDKLVPLTMPQNSDTFRPPFQAVDYLWEHWQSGRIFNNLQIGSLLTMYGPPGLKVFADTRIDVYDEKVLKDYMSIMLVEDGYQSLLNQYGVEWVIVSPADPLSAALARSPQWQRQFQDADGVVFRKKEAGK